MYIKDSYNDLFSGGGIRNAPPSTKSSGSSFNFGDFVGNVLDPLHVFPRFQKGLEKGLDTADHIFNTTLDTAENVADKGGNILNNAGTGLENLSKIFSNPTILLVGGAVVLLVILK